jgi:polyphosphate kinase 2 (PPK2 family)
MDYRKQFFVHPGTKLSLAGIDPAQSGDQVSGEAALPEIQRHVARMAELQALLYADGKQSLLVVLQALDAAGKDGVIRHLFSGMNPQGTSVAGFKQPSADEAAHDFLWRAHQRTPARGEVVVFNRSHYEDVLVVRVHNLVPQAVWSQRYALINDFREAPGPEWHTRPQVLPAHQSRGTTRAFQAAARRPGTQLEDQRIRLLRARPVVRLRRGLRRGAAQDQ